jgi:hypothetical protein
MPADRVVLTGSLLQKQYLGCKAKIILGTLKNDLDQGGDVDGK